MASLSATYTRVWRKRSRRGHAVRTHATLVHLRDDLPSGSSHIDALAEPVLTGHTLTVLDTNVVLHHIDLLERASSLTDVVLLQTVLDETKHNKLSVYKRVRALADDKKRRFHVFCNEFHQGAHAPHRANESPNDRSDRAIRTAVKWYHRQLDGAARVRLVTNDAENRRLAQADGLEAISLRELVRTLDDSDELQDMMAAEASDATATPASTRAAGVRYQPHPPMAELTRGLRAGELHQGKLRVSARNPSRGSVTVHSLPAGPADVLLADRQALNRAVEGDTVVVRLLPRAQWAAASAAAAALSSRHASGGGGAAPADDDDVGVAEAEDAACVVVGDDGLALESVDDVGDAAATATAAAANDDGRAPRPCGEVVGIIKRAWRPYVCVLDPDSAVGNQFLAEPKDARIPRINLTTRQPAQLIGQLILVSIDFWDAAHRFPTGHYVRAFGKVGDKEAESEAILLEHEVNTAPFSPAVQACLPAKGWQIPPDEIARREDLRDGPAVVCSVDPPGCVDIDDALHARELGGGRYEIGVHIADVGHFIKAGTAIDKEAAARATTVYLVGKRIDMVPKRLGEDLCSLHEKVDRLAFSVIWEMDGEANILATRFAKTVIRSQAALSYDEAQMRLDDERLDDPITRSLRGLAQIARALRARRVRGGALTLASPEVRFKIDSETSDPTDVSVYAHKEANSLVEEFMLLANTSVASEITRAFPKAAMLRRHPQPVPGAFDSLNRALAPHGAQLDAASSLTLGASLDACAKPADAYFNKLVRILATRSMQQARYFSAGSVAPSEYRHYGLACPIYTHFTSPIRRYADQVCHRLLAAVLGWEAISQETLDALSDGALVDNLNLRHTMSQHAGRASVGLYTLIFFRKQEIVEDAYVIKVKKNGVVCLVPKYGIEGIVYVAAKGRPSPFVFDEKAGALRAPGCELRILDKVRVSISVDETKAHRPKLELAIVEPVLPRL